MFNIVRSRQLIGLTTLDSSTATRLGAVEEVWVDQTGRVTYFAGSEGYTPLEQVAVVGPDAVLTYSKTLIDPPINLRQLHRLPVRSPLSSPSGWVEDYLFDWETGEITAYILGGDVAAPFGGRAVLFPDDVEVIEAEVIVMKEGAQNRLKSESEGLKVFLSEKSQQVQNLVRQMGDRLKSLVSPQDKPEVVRVKIKEVHDELVASSKHDKNALKEAAEFLQDKWEDVQRSLSRTGNRAKQALESAWKHLTRKQS